MTSANIKSELHRFVDLINDKTVLKALHTTISKQVASGAYSIEGVALSTSKIEKLLAEADTEIGKGKFVTHPELKKRIQNLERKMMTIKKGRL